MVCLGRKHLAEDLRAGGGVLAEKQVVGIAEAAVVFLLFDQPEELALLDHAPLADHADRDVAPAVEGVDRVDERRGQVVVDADRDGQQPACPARLQAHESFPAPARRRSRRRYRCRISNPGTSEAFTGNVAMRTAAISVATAAGLKSNMLILARAEEAAGMMGPPRFEVLYGRMLRAGNRAPRNSYCACFSAAGADHAIASRRRHWPLAFWFFLPYGDRVESWIVVSSEQTKELLMSRDSETADRTEGVDRRSLLKGTASAAILGMSGLGTGLRAAEPAEGGVAVKNGRIKQSIVYWCFEKYWDMDQAIKVAKQLGCDSIELMPPSSSRCSRSGTDNARSARSTWAPTRRSSRDSTTPSTGNGCSKATTRGHRRLRRVRLQERDLLHRHARGHPRRRRAPTTASRGSSRSSATPRRRA